MMIFFLSDRGVIVFNPFCYVIVFQCSVSSCSLFFAIKKPTGNTEDFYFPVQFTPTWKNTIVIYSKYYSVFEPYYSEVYYTVGYILQYLQHFVNECYIIL